MNTTSFIPSALRRELSVTHKSHLPWLTTALLATILAACGGSGGDGSSAATETSSSSSSSGSSSSSSSSSGSSSSSSSSSGSSSSGSGSSSGSSSSSGAEVPGVSAYVGNFLAVDVPGTLVLDVFVSGPYAGRYWWNWMTSSATSVKATCSGVPMDLVVQPPNLSSSCQTTTPSANHTYSTLNKIEGMTVCPVGTTGVTFGHEANVSFVAK